MDKMYLNTIKVMYEKATANMMLIDDNIKLFQLQSGTKFPILPNLFNRLLKDLARKNREGNEKSLKSKRKKENLFLFAVNRI